MIIKNVHMPPVDIADLHILLNNFANCYLKDDLKKDKMIRDLMKDVEYIFEEEYPDITMIEARSNIRNAGRKRSHDDAYDEEIIKLHNNGKSYSQIIKETGCSRSYVSKLIRKQRSKIK